MDSDRAETYLRLLAERELRDRSDLLKLRLAAGILSEAEALSPALATQIVQMAEMAQAVRLQGAGQAGPQMARVWPPSPPVAASIPAPPHEPVDAGQPWQVVPVGRMMRGRTGRIVVSALVRTRELTFLSATLATGEPVPWDDVTELSAADDSGAPYALVRISPGLISVDPYPPDGARWLSIAAGATGAELLRIDLTAASPGTPPFRPGKVPAVERLLTRRAEALLIAAARKHDAQIAAFLPPRFGGMLPDPEEDLVTVGEMIEILEAAGVLSPFSELPAQIAALCQHLDVRSGGLPSPGRLPGQWRSILMQYGRRHRPGARAGVVPLGVQLPELDGVRMVLTELNGSHLHVMTQGPRSQRGPWARSVMAHTFAPPHRPDWAESGLSWWAEDDAGHWHVAGTDYLNLDHMGFAAWRLGFFPPLARDVTVLTVTITGRTGRATVTFPVGNV